MNRPFLKKEHPDLPDSYEITIEYLTGQKPDTIKVASHRIIDRIFTERLDENGNFVKREDGSVVVECIGVNPVPVLEYVTVDDMWESVPMVNIQRLKYCHNFSKMIALKQKEEIDASKK